MSAWDDSSDRRKPKPEDCKDPEHGTPGQRCDTCGAYFRGDTMG